jgi:hypothetical protein
MAEFTFFRFFYRLSDSNTNQYLFEFVYNSSNETPIMKAYLNDTAVITSNLTGSKTYSNTFIFDEASGPQYFYQGAPINAYMDSEEPPFIVSTSSRTYGIFQRSNDANNIYLGSNVKYVTLVTQSSNVKSIVLPKINENPYNQLHFKYVNSSNSFILCAYMSNVSYPITTSQFTTTGSNYEGVFDSKLFGSYSNAVALTGFVNAAFSCISDSSNWYYTNTYVFNLFAPGQLASFPEALIDSNSQILYYRFDSNSTLSTIQLSAESSRYIKYITIRNDNSNSVQFYIIGPQNSKIETASVDSGSYPYIDFSLNSGQMRTVGMYYVANTSNYYIMSDYNTAGLLSIGYPGSLTTLSNQVGIIYNINRNIKLAEPIQQLGFARFNTILGIQTSNLTVYVAAPENNTSNSIVTSNAFVRAVSLENNSNTTDNFSYTFATFYLNSSNTSISLPLYRYANVFTPIPPGPPPGP